MARPDLGKKWNYVVDFWADGCDGPLSVYFEAAYPAILRAALSYYCPDPVQIFTGWARPSGLPKGLRTGSHGRGTRSSAKKGGFWRRFRKVFGFHPDEWLAKKMPFADDMAGRQVPNGAQWMWSAYGAIERFNNYMFMYAIVEDFFYEWSAGVARSVYCQNQQAAVLVGRSDRQGHFALRGQSPCLIGEIDKLRNVMFQGGNGCRPNVAKYHAMFSCKKLTRWDNNPDTSVCKLVVLLPDGQRVEMTGADGHEGGMTVGITSVAGPVSFVLEGDYSFWADDIEFLVFGNQPVPAIRPEGWCNKLVDGAINWAEARSAE